MPIAEIFTINYICAHNGQVSLAHLPAGRRYVEAARLENLLCPKCMAKKRQKAKQIKEQKMTYQQAIKHATTNRLPELLGSPADVQKGTIDRYRLLDDLQYLLVATGGLTAEQFAEMYLAPARTITAASWWSLYRDVTGQELLEALNTAVYQPKAPAEAPF